MKRTAMIQNTDMDKRNARVSGSIQPVKIHYVWKNRLSLLLLSSLILTAGCARKAETSALKTTVTLTTESMIADTVIYPVTILNPDPNDQWTEYRLGRIQREKLVTEVFEALYAGQLTAYHYYTDKPLTVDDIKTLETEPDFSRSRIEEIQFVETWHFSPLHRQFQKEVHSMVLAYALFTEGGERRGLKAAFRIKLNETAHSAQGTGSN